MNAVLAALRAELHVSVSQVRTYLMCPKLYVSRYVLGLEREHRSPNLILGSAVHEALAGFYVAMKAGESMPVEELVQTFADAFETEAVGEVRVLLPEGTEIGDIKDKGVGMLTVFAEKVKVPERVISVEQPFAVDIIDPDSGEVIEEQLVGAIDATVVDDGETVILEHKTSARRWSQVQLDYDLQAGVYLGVTDASLLRFQVLLKTRAPGFVTYDVTRTEEARVEALLVLCRVLDAIRAGIAWPNRGWQCRNCEYRTQCSGRPG